MIAKQICASRAGSTRSLLSRAAFPIWRRNGGWMSEQIDTRRLISPGMVHVYERFARSAPPSSASGQAPPLDCAAMGDCSKAVRPTRPPFRGVSGRYCRTIQGHSDSDRTAHQSSRGSGGHRVCRHRVLHKISQWFFNNRRRLEFELLWGLLCVACFKGGGRYSVDHVIDEEF
jgi:hypothetical protein